MVFAFNGCISVLTALLVYYSVHGYQRRMAKVDLCSSHDFLIYHNAAIFWMSETLYFANLRLIQVLCNVTFAICDPSLS